jgi:hypothetical protein
LHRQFGLEKLFRVDAPALDFDKLRLACEEAALSHGLNVPLLQVIRHSDAQVSSDGQTLYLSSDLEQMPSVPLAALISFALYFHSHRVASQRDLRSAPRGLGQKLASLIVGLRSAPVKIEQAQGAAAREEAKTSYKGNHSALLQALLMSRSGLQTECADFPGAPLFEDAEQINDFAQHLEGLIEGDFPDAFDQLLPAQNKLLKLAHKTSKLLDAGDRHANNQVASLNRLYQSIGPVGSVASIINRVSDQRLCDTDRTQVLVELMTTTQPLQARLQLVDFAASQLLALTVSQRMSLITQLRETLSGLANQEATELAQPLKAFGESQILTWTLMSVLRSKLHISETDGSRQRPLTDKAKRRCIGELFFIAAELGGEESSISARALRNQVDAVCESLDMDRPVSSPDEFQAAAWLEALDDLSRFSLHETLSILDALSAWGKENVIYQAWFDAICQRLKVQRQLALDVNSPAVYIQGSLPQNSIHADFSQPIRQNQTLDQ